jgi:hypothetical protein
MDAVEGARWTMGGSEDTTRTHIPVVSGEPPLVPLSDGFSIGQKPPVAASPGGTSAGLVVLVVGGAMLLSALIFAVAYTHAPRPSDPSGDFARVGEASEHDGVAVRLLSATERTGNDGKLALFVRVSVKNATKDRKWFYRPMHYAPEMRDDLGNVYAHHTWEYPEGGVSSRNNPLGPGERIADVLVFDRTIPAAKRFVVTVPGRLLNTGPDESGDHLPDFRFLIRSDQVARE